MDAGDWLEWWERLGKRKKKVKISKFHLVTSVCPTSQRVPRVLLWHPEATGSTAEAT